MQKVFELAVRQCLREGIRQPSDSEIISRAITIIEWLKKHSKKVEAIKQGQKVYKYGNIIKTYAEV